jgi:hypothetical protein
MLDRYGESLGDLGAGADSVPWGVPCFSADEYKN